MNVAFYIDEMNFRGIANSTYDYALQNKLLLKNNSIIFYNKRNQSNKIEVIKKFKKKFKTFGINQFSEIDEFKNQSMEDLKKKEELIKKKQNEFNSQKNILSQDEIKTRIKNIEDEVQKFNSERKSIINEYEIKKKRT